MNKKIFLLILCASSLILVAGLTSQYSLGDEAYHYRFAKDIFNAGKRVAFESMYGKEIPPGYFYYTEPFWHMVLAFLWKIFGGISLPLAQFYQTLYYALLLLFTYLLGKELYGKTQGFYSALIVATIPAVAAFSILFYVDIPVTALSVLCFYLIVKRKFLLSGFILGIMYLTKRNSYFFLPAVFLLTFSFSGGNLRVKIKNLVYILIPISLFILSDFLWRKDHIKSVALINTGNMIVKDYSDFMVIKNRLMLSDWNLRVEEYLNSSLLNPLDIIKYFGIVILITLVMYILFKKYEKRDWVLWLPVICYVLLFFYIFHPGSDIRYLLPIVPLLSVLSSKAAVIYSNRKIIKSLIIILCLMQFVSAVLYVRSERQISEGIKEGFAYLKENTSSDTLIIYPEYVILEATNRRFAWTGNLPGLIRNIFWNKNDGEVKKMLESFKVNFIAIKKSRIYDDSKVHHYGGYPRSFVERLPTFSFLKLVFDNQEMGIWKVQ